MALIVIPRRVPWRRKPGHLGPSIQRQFAKYGFLFAESAGDAFSGDRLATLKRDGTANTEWGVSEHGVYLARTDTTDFVERITTNNQDLIGGLAEITIHFVFVWNTRGAIDKIGFFGRWDTGNTQLLFRLENNTNKVRVILNNGSSSSDLTSTITANGAGLLNIASLRWRAGEGVNIFINGKKDSGSGATLSGTIKTSSTGQNLFGGDTSQASAAGKAYGLLINDRFESDVEVLEFHANPWRVVSPRTQRIFIPLGGTKTATFVLNDKDSAAVANATGIRWAWFDQMPGSSMAAPTDKGPVETTDGSGSLSVDIPNSTLTSGQTGYLSISNSDGTIATNHLQGGGPAKVD